MKSQILGASLAALIAVGLGVSAARAQPYGPDASQAQADSNYDAQSRDYQQKQDAYQRAQAHYQDQSAVYAERRADFMRDRDDYDARHGAGAFVRYRVMITAPIMTSALRRWGL